jgi:hypothetical protein
MKRHLWIIGFLVVIQIPPAAAALENENLIQVLPKGYKLGNTVHEKNIRMHEYFPEGQDPDDWSEMLTTQIYQGMGQSPHPPEQYLRKLAQSWLSYCAGSTVMIPPSASTISNGYPTATLMIHCPFSPVTGKPEYTLFRAIKGTDGIYLVQKAFAYAPNSDQVEQAFDYLASVYICDTRSNDHPCPDVDTPDFREILDYFKK